MKLYPNLKRLKKKNNNREKKMHQDLLTVEEITKRDLEEIFKLAENFKKNRSKSDLKPLAGKSVGMIFSKSSTRTRISFEVGVHELGGNAIYLEQSKMQVGRGETIADTAKVLSRYLHAIVIRTHKHEDVMELAKHSHIPVINALTDKFHPCQALSDLFTIYEFSEKLEGTKLAYFGDGASNMANSLILAAKLTGMELKIAAPEEFKPDEKLINKPGEGVVTWEKDPAKAAENADYLYTDVWVSMGFEEEAKERLKILQPYQLNSDIMDLASPEARILHCLPAHRDEEITADVFESPQSVVFDQAENRLHVQKAIMTMMLGGK
jgi:ornithine carbamoyltransferase